MILGREHAGKFMPLFLELYGTEVKSLLEKKKYTQDMHYLKLQSHILNGLHLLLF